MPIILLPKNFSKYTSIIIIKIIINQVLNITSLFILVFRKPAKANENNINLI